MGARPFVVMLSVVVAIAAGCNASAATTQPGSTPTVPAATTAPATLAPTPTAVPSPPPPSASPSPTPLPSISATPSPTPAPSKTAKPSQSPTPTPSKTATPSPTPFPAGAPGALAAVKAYENYLVGGKFQQAWTLLGPGYKSQFSSYSAWLSERKQFLLSSGKTFTAVSNPTGVLPLADWISPQPWASEIDAAHAVLVRVDWTKLAGDNAGWEIWVANRTNSGMGWALYQAR